MIEWVEQKSIKVAIAVLEAAAATTALTSSIIADSHQARSSSQNLAGKH